MTTFTPTEESLIHLEIASRDFLYFLEFVKIQVPVQAGASESGVVDFIIWPHLKEMADQLYRPWGLEIEEITKQDRQTVVGKARQVGFSWMVAAYNTWLAFCKNNATCLMTSQGEHEASDLLKKCKFIYDNLPELWRQHRTPQGRSNSASEMILWDMDSVITALPSTEKAGRGTTASCVTMDEFDFHSEGAANLSAVMPAIDAGGQIIIGSTVDKNRAQSTFQSIIKSADRDGWKLLFFPYTARPERDEEWYKDRMRSIPDEQLKGMSREQFMEQEYPRSIGEMLSAPRATAYFDNEILDLLDQLAKELGGPIKRDGDINYYSLPKKSGKYIAGSDTASGDGGEHDSSVTVILDVSGPVESVVADIHSNRLKIDDFVSESLRLLESFYNPMWVIENNGIGTSTAQKAASLYPGRSLWKPAKSQKNSGAISKLDKPTPGLNVTHGNREIIWNEFKDAVNNGEVRIYSTRGIQDLRDTIHVPRSAGGSGRPEARRNAHDDYTSACAVAHYCKSDVVRSKRKTPVQRPPVA